MKDDLGSLNSLVNPGSNRIKDKMRFDLMVSWHSDSGIKHMTERGREEMGEVEHEGSRQLHPEPKGSF